MSLHMTKHVCFKSGHIVEFSRDAETQFDSMSHASKVVSKPAVSFIHDCNMLWAFTLHLAGHKPACINLCQPPSRVAQEQNSESGGPGHRQLKPSWPCCGNKTGAVSPTCSTPRWML